MRLPRLDYRGGPLLGRVRVVPVLWGPGLSAEVSTGLGPFYRELVRAPVYDFLSEYDAAPDGGALVHLQPGTALDPVTITPLNRGTQLEEFDLGQELRAQLAAGALPAPDPDTLYMLHFPPGVHLQQGQSQDCSVALGGQFCAYHSTVRLDGGTAYFAALPDLGDGFCSSRCSNGLWPFDALTSIASHEVFEAVTDPVPGASWYDRQRADGVSPHSEIGDICELPWGTEPRLQGPAGPTYVVQREWSNHFQACLVSRQDVFPVSGLPAEVGVAPGDRVTVRLEVGPPASGLDQDVQVVVAGVPAGVDLQAAVAPFLLRPGQPAQLTLTAGPTLAPDSYPLEVLFVGQRATLFQALTVVVALDTRPLSVAPAALRLDASGAASAEVDGVDLPGADGGAGLALAAEGLPPGLVASFSPATLAGGQPSQLTLSRLPGAPPARAAPFTVVARGEGIRRAAAATVDAEGDDFGLALDFTRFSIAPGGTATVLVRTTATGTPRPLALVLEALPPATVGVLQPETVLAGETATLTLVAEAGAPPGAGTLVLRAQGPWSSRTALGTVTVQAPGAGCGAAGGGPWAVGLALLALGRRRRRAAGLALAAVLGLSAPAQAQALLPHAGYAGGPVLAAVKVVVVHWGPAVDPALQAALGPFLRDALGGPGLDWLSEYGTSIDSVDGVRGTGQAIGRGRYAGAVTLTPANASATLFTADVEDELLGQLQRGALPAPDADTLYLVYLPPTVSWEGNDADCHQLCGTRRYFERQGFLVTYAVIPDCARVCAGPGPALDNFTTLTWFEVVRSVTDPRRVQGTLGRPHAWLDPALGDVGLICDGAEAVGTLAAADGGAWRVHRAWSNLASACLVDRGTSFSVAVDPPGLDALRGGLAQGTVSVSSPREGPPQAVTLDAAGVPFGVTVGFSPAALHTGERATVTVQTSASSASRFDFLVRAHGPGALASALASVSTTAAGFSAGLTPLALELTPGGQASAVLHAEATLGPAQPLTPAATSLPPGVSATFDPPTFSTEGKTTLLLTAAGDAPASVGPFAVTVTGPGGRQVVVGGLTVSGEVLGLVPSASRVVLRPGGRAEVGLATAPSAGGGAKLTLAAEGLPPGVQASFQPAQVRAGGSAVLTLEAGPGAAPGLSVVALSAGTPSAEARAHLVLEVQPPGCEAAGGAPLAWLALGWLAARRRWRERRRR